MPARSATWPMVRRGWESVAISSVLDLKTT
jgi:hypothetical protein